MPFTLSLTRLVALCLLPLSDTACCSVCAAITGSYYIEVFSKAYRKQFEGDAEARRRLQLELLINGNLPDEEVEPPSPGATPPASPDKAEVLNLEVEGAGAVAGGSGFGAAVQVASSRQTRRNKVKSPNE